MNISSAEYAYPSARVIPLLWSCQKELRCKTVHLRSTCRTCQRTARIVRITNSRPTHEEFKTAVPKGYEERAVGISSVCSKTNTNCKLEVHVLACSQSKDWGDRAKLRVDRWLAECLPTWIWRLDWQKLINFVSPADPQLSVVSVNSDPLSFMPFSFSIKHTRIVWAQTWGLHTY